MLSRTINLHVVTCDTELFLLCTEADVPVQNRSHVTTARSLNSFTFDKNVMCKIRADI